MSIATIRAAGFLLATLVASSLLALEPSVSFVAPGHLATAMGRSKIALRVEIPEGLSAVRVELSVDGRPLKTLTGSPWTAEWSAGDGSRGHDLVAVLHLSDGRTVRSNIRTSPLRIDQVESVNLVNLYVVVRDGGDKYVNDLAREDFRILEDGQLQTIDRFSASRRKLTIGIVLDTSKTMRRGDKLETAKRAAVGFLENLQTTDRGLVVTFNDEVRIVQESTADTSLIASAIESASARGGTALYDAIWQTARLLRGFDGRRVLVLLSDGKDEAFDGMGPGSLHTLGEATEQALLSEVMVFAIGLGNLYREYALRWGDLGGASNRDVSRSLGSILERLAESTGGRMLPTSSAGRIKRAFTEIADDLRHQYSIAYVSNDLDRRGEWREVQVLVANRKLKVVTRKGYYATPFADEDP